MQIATSSEPPADASAGRLGRPLATSKFPKETTDGKLRSDNRDLFSGAPRRAGERGGSTREGGCLRVTILFAALVTVRTSVVVAGRSGSSCRRVPWSALHDSLLVLARR